MSVLVKREKVVKPVKFLDRVAKIMSDPEVSTFMDDYFSSVDDAKTTLMMIKTYSILRDKFVESTGKEPSKVEMVNIMKNAMANRDFRIAMVANMNQFMNDGILPTSDLLIENKGEN